MPTTVALAAVSGAGSCPHRETGDSGGGTRRPRWHPPAARRHTRPTGVTRAAASERAARRLSGMTRTPQHTNRSGRLLPLEHTPCPVVRACEPRVSRWLSCAQHPPGLSTTPHPSLSDRIIRSIPRGHVPARQPRRPPRLRVRKPRKQLRSLDLTVRRRWASLPARIDLGYGRRPGKPRVWRRTKCELLRDEGDGEGSKRSAARILHAVLASVRVRIGCEPVRRVAVSCGTPRCLFGICAGCGGRFRPARRRAADAHPCRGPGRADRRDRTASDIGAFTRCLRGRQPRGHRSARRARSGQAGPGERRRALPLPRVGRERVSDCAARRGRATRGDSCRQRACVPLRDVDDCPGARTGSAPADDVDADHEGPEERPPRPARTRMPAALCAIDAPAWAPRRDGARFLNQGQALRRGRRTSRTHS